MDEFYSINRYALIVRPKKALIDWVNYIFPEDPVDFREIEEEPNDGMDVFLIPEFDDIEDALEWLKENHATFLEYSLEAWCTDEADWPSPLNWDLFERFLDYSIQSVVIDVVPEEEDRE